MTDPMTHDLQRLQAAIDQQNIAQVHAFFEAADLVACNDLLLEAGKQYGFHTEVIDAPPANGQRLMLGRDLSRLMYQDPDLNALGPLLRRYAMDFVSIRGFSHDVKTLLVNCFGLNKFDGKAAFCTWNHFVLVGMYGQTEAARKVRAQLLKDHRAWRINQKVEESTGKSARQHLVDNILDAYPEYRAIADLAQAAAQNRRLAEEAKASADAAQERARLAEGKAEQALYGLAWVTLRQYAMTYNMKQQLPESMQREYGLWLRGYCLEHNIPFYKTPPADRAWDYENTYPVTTIQLTLPGWLRRYHGQVAIVPLRARP
jgi:hypothetical protein